MATLNRLDQIKLSDGNTYLCVEVVPDGDHTYYILQNRADESFRVGEFADDGDFKFARGEEVAKKIQDYIQTLPDEA